jgi:hypothetical protein
MALRPQDDDDLLSLAFSLQNNPGAYALLVGAGISKPVVPTAWEVLTRLIVDVAALNGDKITADEAEGWWLANVGAEPRYETVLERVAPTQIERQRLLRQFFEPADDPLNADDAATIEPTLAHKSIARLVKMGVVKVIVTMNFDHLLEAAIRAEGIEPTIVVTEADIRGLAPLHTLDCCLIHLHGDYMYPESMLNTKSELQIYKPSVRRQLREIIQQYGLIVSGWSARYDPALRETIKIHHPQRLTMLWMEPGEPLSLEATQLVQLKKALVTRATAEDGFGKLADAVESMQTRRARQPLTASTAAETAKRELAGRWTAIRLHDALKEELERLHANPNFHLPNHNNAANYGGYEALIASTEEATRVVASIVAVLAYWGNADNDDWWIDELERFATPVRGGGLTSLLELRVIAGTILYYAAGVAACLTKRHDLTARILRLERDDPLRYGRRQLLADVLEPAAHAYRETHNPNSRHFLLVSRLLTDALSIRGDQLQDAWQTFEVLRIATAAQRMLIFNRNASDYYRIERELASSLQEFPDLGSTGAVDPVEISMQRGELNRQRFDYLDRLAQATAVNAQHVLGRDTHGAESWVNPVAQRLHDELLRDKSAHPLVLAGIGLEVDSISDRWLGLSIALRAVSHAIGKRAINESWKWAPGALPDMIWLDTGETAG